jgi:hypothetical protein
MAKQTKSRKKTITLKKGFKWYPLKKETIIGNELKPVGYKIQLNEDGRKFYKRKNII